MNPRNHTLFQYMFLNNMDFSIITIILPDKLMVSTWYHLIVHSEIFVSLNTFLKLFYSKQDPPRITHAIGVIALKSF